MSGVISIAGELIQDACRIDGRGRTGGMLCVADNGGPIILYPIGVLADEAKKMQYSLACLEKARRLLQNPRHITSWESRDVDQKKYGGAILAGRFAFSFSGFTEHVDEALSTVIAYRVDKDCDITKERWEYIREASGNPHMHTYGCLLAA